MIRKIVALLVSVQMIFQAPIAMAQSNQRSRQAPAAPSMFHSDDPLWQEFINSAKLTAGHEEDWQIPFDIKEPSLDQDPFFLRQQNWTATNSKVKTLSFQNKTIYIPGLNTALTLQVPLTPFHATSEFVFLSLDQKAPHFKLASGSEAPGEGIFFISRSDLLAKGLSKQPVPIFFLPLSGQGWQGPIDSVELPELDVLTIANRNQESVALELNDVNTIMQAQLINLTLAMTFTVKTQIAELINGTQIIYPAKGSTASFGLFFTGLDLDHPQKSYWKSAQLNSKDLNSSASFAALQAKIINPFISKIRNSPFMQLVQPILGIDSAHADDATMAIAIQKIAFIGSILAGMLAVSVVIKYAHPGVRAKLKAQRAGEAPTHLLGRIGRETKDIFSVFAAVSTTVAQFPSVTFATALEMFLDRFAPTLAAADHTIIRRILKNTFYFSRDSMRKTPVNSKTFFLGAVVMGTSDTASVGVQYTVAIPEMAKAVEPYVDPEMQQKINTSMDLDNPATKNLIIFDVIRNMLGWLQNGAASFSQESRAQILGNVIKDVESKMIAEGKDPNAPENQAAKQAAVDKGVDFILRQQGLPGQDVFLFDSSTLIDSFNSFVGYKAPQEQAAEASFLLASRSGLSKNSLIKALKQAKEYAEQSPSETAQQTVMILEETLSKLSLLMSSMRGIEGIKEARDVRMQLTLLSYEGPVDWAVRYLPETWKTKFSTEAAQAAGLIFRQALYSYLSTEGNSLLKASEESRKEFSIEAKQKVDQDLRQSHPELAHLSASEFEAQVQSKYSLERKLKLQLEIASLSRQKAQNIRDANYQPEKTSWLERYQYKKAEAAANEKLAEATMLNPNLSPEESQKLWKQHFTQALAKQVGLYVESREFVESRASRPSSSWQTRQETAKYLTVLNAVEKAAAETTESLIANDKGLNKYLNALSEFERLKYSSLIYANNYLQAYRSFTTENEIISGLAPQQPGRLQAIRQTEFVRQNPTLTRILRGFESFFNDQAIRPGWHAAFERNIPLFSDMWNSHKRSMKTMLPALTINYLWSYYAWHVNIPYGTWAVMIALGASTISAPSQWLNRSFRMNELKAMDGIGSRLLYSIPYSWVTFFGMIPTMIFSSDINRFYHDSVREPFLHALGQVPHSTWLATATALGLLIVGNEKVITKTSEAIEKVKGFLKPQRPSALIEVRCSAVYAH